MTRAQTRAQRGLATPWVGGFARRPEWSLTQSATGAAASEEAVGAQAVVAVVQPSVAQRSTLENGVVMLGKCMTIPPRNTKSKSAAHIYGALAGVNVGDGCVC